MGCNDYYDPSRERGDERWRDNNTLVNRSGCKRITAGGADFYVVCCDCGAMVWTGDLRREDDLPFVRVHHHWHATSLAGVGLPEEPQK